MAYEFHDTSHVEKRAQERGFTVDQAMLTVNEPASILKTPPRRGNHGGMLWLFFRVFGSRTLVVVAEIKVMNAGSSPDTGSDLPGFVILITEPPIVEIDTEATAVYIRLREAAVARTEPFDSRDGLVMLDFDQAGNVVGIEIVGQQEFSIRELLKRLPVEATDAVLNQTRYIAADLQAA